MEEPRKSDINEKKRSYKDYGDVDVKAESTKHLVENFLTKERRQESGISE